MEPQKIIYGTPCREISPEELKRYTSKEKKEEAMERVVGFLNKVEKQEHAKEKRSR